jgi:hypothetical protein
MAVLLDQKDTNSRQREQKRRRYNKWTIFQGARGRLTGHFVSISNVARSVADCESPGALAIFRSRRLSFLDSQNAATLFR